MEHDKRTHPDDGFYPLSNGGGSDGGAHRRDESSDSTYTYPPPREPQPFQSYNFTPAPPAPFKMSPPHDRDDDDEHRRHELIRTPSPTPSEAKELRSGAVDWKAMASPKFWFRREWLWYYVAIVGFSLLFGLLLFYHKQIVNKLSPEAQKLRHERFGWLVPIAVLFVISFPPLFGHEIVAPLCGFVWGLWVGFAIVAAGTLLGEIGNFYAFKYCLRSRAEKLEKKGFFYASLARVVREGGFKIALIVRLSVVPGHFATAVFATCGMNILVFIAAATLSMPKQLITVYLGTLLAQSNSGVKDTKSTTINIVVLVLTIIITAVAMWYILAAMNKVKPIIIYERRKARQAKLLRAEHDVYMSSDDLTVHETEVFNPTSHTGGHQQWDQNGKAVGYSVVDPSIAAPQPRRTSLPPARFFDPPSRDEEEGLDNIALQTPTQANYHNAPKQYFNNDRPSSGPSIGGNPDARTGPFSAGNPWNAPSQPPDRVPAWSAPPR